MIVLLLLAPSVASAKDKAKSKGKAAPECIAEYEQAAQPYWRIASDIVTFKSMFDDYDRLCTRHYPDDIAALQPMADTLRSRTDTDVTNITPVMNSVFQDTLPGAVSEKCAADKKARATVQKNFLNTATAQSSRINTRLQKSALTVQNPDSALKLCRDLGKWAPKIQKTLGSDLHNPLLEMTAIHSKIIVRDEKQRRAALAVWRDTVAALNADQP